MGRADAMDVDGRLGHVRKQRARSARMIHMHMRDQQVFYLGGIVSTGANRIEQRLDGRARANIHQRQAVGAGEQIAGDDARLILEEGIQYPEVFFELASQRWCFGHRALLTIDGVEMRADRDREYWNTPACAPHTLC